MKQLQVVFTLVVFAGISIAFLLARPRTPDAGLFGAEMALTPELEPLELPRGKLSVHGRVQTSAGLPAENAFVVLVAPESDSVGPEPLYHAYTDGDGAFAIEHLLPGSYRAILTHPSAPPTELALEAPVEGALSWTLAEPLEPLPTLPELTRTSISGHVRLPAPFATSTEAANAETNGLEGFEVILTPTDDTPPFSGAAERRTACRPDGGFEIPALVLARYRIEVLPPWARGGTWPTVASETRLITGDDVLELTLQVGALEGRLQEADSRPLVGALVRLSSAEHLDPVGRERIWPPLVTDPDGRFRIDLVPPGLYRLHLRAGSAANDSELEVRSGEVTVIPLVTMEPRSGEGPGG